jgi:hypothetical protein
MFGFDFSASSWLTETMALTSSSLFKQILYFLFNLQEKRFVIHSLLCTVQSPSPSPSSSPAAALLVMISPSF